MFVTVTNGGVLSNARKILVSLVIDIASFFFSLFSFFQRIAYVGIASRRSTTITYIPEETRARGPPRSRNGDTFFVPRALQTIRGVTKGLYRSAEPEDGLYFGLGRTTTDLAIDTIRRRL